MNNHIGEGKRIPQGPLPGVSGCHSGGPTSPLDIKCCGGWDHGLDSGGERGVPDRFLCTMADKAALFYADASLITSTNRVCL